MGWFKNVDVDFIEQSFAHVERAVVKHITEQEEKIKLLEKNIEEFMDAIVQQTDEINTKILSLKGVDLENYQEIEKIYNKNVRILEEKFTNSVRRIERQVVTKFEDLDQFRYRVEAESDRYNESFRELYKTVSTLAIGPDVRISELEMSMRLRNVLVEKGIVFLKQATEYDTCYFLKSPNFGRKSLRELQEILAHHGMKLKAIFN